MQTFHLDRAPLICNSLGIESIGSNADGLRPEGYGFQQVDCQIRELTGTALPVFDLLRGAKPTWLGEPLPIQAHFQD